MKSILGLRWLLSLAPSGAIPTHRLSFENQRKKRKATMMKHRSRTLCYFALPLLILVACVLQPLPAQAQMTSVGIDCSQIHSQRIMEQENLRAGIVLIECGVAQGGQPSDIADGPTAPPNIRVSNRACSSDTSCTK